MRISLGLASRFTAQVARSAEGHATDQDDAGKPWQIVVEWRRSAAKATVIRPTGDLRGDGAMSLQRTLAGELTGTPELFVLDLSDVEQIDADGIDALHSIAELADEDDIQFCLVITPRGALPTCLKVVELTKVFQTFSSITEALQHDHDGPGQHWAWAESPWTADEVR
jgi:anti-anti-sigma regulatory factor